jgi:hypothetical protein
MKNKFISSSIFLIGFTLLSPAPRAGAELKGAESPLGEQMMKTALSQEREQAFANVMKDLPADQQRKFWTMYKDYATEKTAFDSRRLKLLDQYMTNYLLLTPGQANDLMSEWIDLQQAQLKSRIKMFKKLSRQVSAVVGTRFYQMDDYLYSAEKVQYLSHYPIFGERPQAKRAP